MSSQKKSDNDVKDPIKEKPTNDETSENEEEYKGRNWNQMIIAVVFVLIVVILWYVLSR
ncbi:MAG: hypothetical protein GOP50_04710, partial [Candidatus Heimdallarchaeota archaeon]|nr:hypothetical protein [Candidatus Heimdallarchaeota archaeon]